MSEETEHSFEHIVPRVLRLEWKTDYHQKQLNELHQDNKVQQAMLESINKRLSAIFWAIVGAVSVALANEFGLLAAIKALM